MRHLIMSDIHGRYDELMLALGNARYDETSDRLIVLGDVIDRGRQSRQVLEYLAGLVARGRDIELVRGNHEDLVQAFLEGRIGALKHWLYTCQGVSLLWSYGFNHNRLKFAGDRVWADGAEIMTRDDARAFLLAFVPGEHLSVIEGMRRYRLVIPRALWNHDLFCCHAGLVHNTRTRETPQWLFCWGDPAWQNGRSADYQPITVYGHFHQPIGPLVRYRRVCLAVEGAVAVLIPEEQVIVTSDGDCIEVRPERLLTGQDLV